MNGTETILEVSNVAIEQQPPYETGLWSISLTLQPGALLLVLLETEHERIPLADAAEGLVTPSEGSVKCFGEDWQTMSADRAAEQRGRIGRVFDDEGWFSDLDVTQNILLSQRHHTRRSDDEILDEALGLSRLFGLPGLPRSHPSKVRRLDLRKAACVRAFLGQPTLILLERPARGAYADLIAPLINAVQSARRRGTAVLWTMADLKAWNNPGLRASGRAKMFGSQMHMMESYG